MKKLLSTVLALACVSSMAVTSFAATAPTNVSDSSDSVSDYVMPRERLYYIKDISCGSASWKPQAPIEMKEGYGLKVQFWHNNTTDYPAELVVKNLATGQEKSTVIPAHTKDHPPIVFFVSSEDCTFDVTIQNPDGNEVGGEFAAAQYKI